MQWVVTTGATVEEAKVRALDALGIDDGDLEFAVLDEPGTTLFGLRPTEARIRARVRPTRPRPKMDRRNRRKPSGNRGSKRRRPSSGKGRDGSGRDDTDPTDDDASDATDDSGTDARTADDGGRSGRSRRSRGGRGRQPDRDESPADADAAAGADAVEPDGSHDVPTPSDASPPTPRRGRGADRGSDRVVPSDDPVDATDAPDATIPAAEIPGSEPASTRAPASERSGDTPSNTDDSPTVGTTGAQMSDITLDEQEPTATSFLEGLLEAFDADADVSSSVVDDGETLEITVEGDDLGLLVGQRGTTLNALQELTRTAVAQQHSGRLDGRLRVDVAGYRARRKEALTRFAIQQAERVLESGAKIALEPMSPPDRKIVHDALNEFDGVHTASEGEDRRRHVVLLLDD